MLHNKNEHKFWNNMPINNTNNKNEEILKLTENKTYTNIPMKLPGKLTWYNIDLTNDIIMITEFLNNNYVGKDNNIKFIFSPELLNWLLSYDKKNKNLAIGVKYNDKIVGCIFGLVRKLNLKNKIINGSETNLLCLSKNIRGLNIAPIMIQELTRRNNYFVNINQSIYTTDLVLPNIISSVNYIYRYINIRKMIDNNFIKRCLEEELGFDTIKKYYHHHINKIKGKVLLINELNNNQILQCCELLNKKISEMNLGYFFDENLFKHTFLNSIVKCWVIFKKGKITDMISCYFQDSKLKNNLVIKNCNLFYYFKGNNSLKALTSLVIKFCINNNIDRIKVLKIMDYNELEDFNFDEGTTNINYYIYNWYSTKINYKNISYFVI
tara:strand:+ start:1675 stop:2817 length:1143 start_codon:yes stop_codon:yes gene_type:complete